MKNRKSLIIYLSIDLLLIVAFICNDTFGLFQIMVDTFNKAMEWLAPKPSTTQLTYTGSTKTTTSTSTDPGPIIPDIYDYPIKIYFDGMGGDKVEGDDYFYLDGEEYTVEDLVAPTYELEEYEFIRWELATHQEDEDGDIVNIWEYYAVWEYAPVGFYTKIKVDDSFSYSVGAYTLTVETDTTTLDLSELFEYRASFATATVYSDAELTAELDIDNLELEMGDNIYYLYIDASENGNATYRFNIHRTASYNITFNITGVLTEIEGLEDYVASEGDNLSWVSEHLNQDGIHYAYTVDLNATLEADTQVDIETSYIEYAINYVIPTDDTINDNPLTYTIADSVNLVDLVKEDYEFFGWYSDELLTEEATGIEAGSMGDKTFYAKISAIDYIGLTVDESYTFDGDYYNLTVDSEQTSLTDLSDRITYNTTYAHVNIYTDFTCTDEVDIASLPLVMGDNIYYLKVTATKQNNTEISQTYAFKIHRTYSYNITFTVNGVLTSITGLDDCVIYEGDTLNFVNAKLNQPGITYNVDVDLSAVVTSDTHVSIDTSYTVYTITYVNVLEGVDNSANPLTYTVVTPTINLAGLYKEDYEFLGWYRNSAMTLASNKIPLGSTGNKTFYAKHLAIDYAGLKTDDNFSLSAGVYRANVTTDTETYDLSAHISYRSDYGSVANAYSDSACTIPVDLTNLALAIGDNIYYVKVVGHKENNDEVSQVYQFNIHRIYSYEITINVTGVLSDIGLGNFTAYEWQTLNVINNYLNQPGITYDVDVDLSAEVTSDTIVNIDTSYTIYTITYHNVTGAVHTNPSTYTVIDNIILDDADKDDYEFFGWYTDEGLTNAITSIPEGSTGNIDVYAKLIAIDYLGVTVSDYFTYDDVEETYYVNVDQHTTNIDLGSMITYRSDYSQARVYTNRSLTFLADINNLTPAIGLNNYYLVIDSGIHGSATYHFIVNRYERYEITFVVTGLFDHIEGIEDYVAGGNEKLNWITDFFIEPGVTYEVDQDMNAVITDDMTVNIVTSYTNYAITYEGTLGADNSNPGTYTIIDTIELQPIEKTGYTFEGWYLDSLYTEEASGIEAGSTGAITFYAKMTIITYTITYELDGGEATNVETYTVADEVVLTKASKLGYIFDNWEIYTSETEHQPYDGTFNYASDLVIKASYHDALETAFYGKYPQELVTDYDLLVALSSVEADENGIYHHEGEEYVKVIASPFMNGVTYSDGSDVIKDGEYFFKVLPIEWIILYQDNNQYTVMSKKILDAHIFDEATNNYAASSIATYLAELIAKLFTEEEANNIVMSTVRNTRDLANEEMFSEGGSWGYTNIDAKIYLPSYYDVHEYLEDMSADVTDYARAVGVYYRPKTGKGFYYYRSPYTTDRDLYVAGYDASPTGGDNGSLLIDKNYGLRIMMTVISGSTETEGDSNE